VILFNSTLTVRRCDGELEHETLPHDVPLGVYYHFGNKKFELMLTRCAKAYNSSCSQIALVYLQPFHCFFTFEVVCVVCATAEDCKYQ